MASATPRSTDFAAALKLIASLPLTDSEKAVTVRHLLAGLEFSQ